MAKKPDPNKQLKECQKMMKKMADSIKNLPGPPSGKQVVAMTAMMAGMKACEKIYGDKKEHNKK